MRTQDPLIAKSLKKKIPLGMHVHPTWNCNLRCLHCYEGLPKTRDPSLRKIKKILDELAAKGYIFLTFTGGEPFTRKDIFEILEYARKKKFAVAIDTNGTFMTKKAAKKIKDLHIVIVRINILGATERPHEKITNVKGSFLKSINALRYLKEAGVNCMLRFTKFSENKEEAKKIKNLARKLQVKYKIYPSHKMKRESFEVYKCSLDI